MEATNSFEFSPQQPNEMSQQPDNSADEATDRLVVAEIENSKGADCLSQISLCEILPQKARPAFNRICSFLRSNVECTDLANFMMASPYFRAEVMEFMGREKNRPGFECAYLKNSENGLRIKLELFSANLPFYDFTNLDWGRCSRVMEDDIPILRVNLTGPNDAVIEQVSGLLSSPFDDVVAGSYGQRPLSTANLTLVDQILRYSSINRLFLDVQNLDEITAPLILSIASHTKSIALSRSNEAQVADPVSFFTHFIQQFDSLPFFLIALGDLSRSSSFFGLPNSFWEVFFNQKLSNGSVKWVQKTNGNEDEEKITEGAIDWSDTRITILHWENAKAMSISGIGSMQTPFSSEFSQQQPKDTSQQPEKPADELTEHSIVAEAQHKEGNDSLSELSMCEILPQKARPAFNRICSFVRTDYTGTDLANLSMSSPYFRAEVIEFMRRDINRPALLDVMLSNSESGLKVKLYLWPTNIPFYNFTNLDWGRFERCMCDDVTLFDKKVPVLQVILNGPNDPVLEQVSGLLLSPFNTIGIGSYRAALSTENLSLAEQILRNSSFGQLYIDVHNLDQITAPLIISIASNAEILYFARASEAHLPDPAAFMINFIDQLNSLPLYRINLCDDSGSSHYFGLPNSFWQNYFNQKLSNGSVEWVREGFRSDEDEDEDEEESEGEGSKITEPTIDWTETEIRVLEWENAVSV